MSNIIKVISPPLDIPANDGKITIAKSNDIFAHIDSDFVNLGLDKASSSTKESKISVGEMVESADFRGIFYSLLKKRDIESLKSLRLTQHQIRDSVKTHRDWLHPDWYTFCLISRKVVKSEKDFFVAYVLVISVGSLGVYVDQLGYVDVWPAGPRHRVFIPQLQAS